MGRPSSICSVIGLCLLGCGQRPPTTPRVIVPDSLKPPQAGAAGPRLPTLEERLAADGPADEPTAERRVTPPADAVVPPSDWGGCLRSRMCQLEGMCSPGPEGLCMAADDDDCKPSDACLGGRCSAKEGRCVAASNEDCRGSWACRGWGRCSYDGVEACMATSAADCRGSTRCSREGECNLHAGACVAAPPP